MASPSAHGHATMRTATVAENANVESGVAPQPVAERPDGDRDHDRDENAGDTVGQTLHGRLSGLRVGNEPCDLRERRVRADTLRLDDKSAADVDGQRRQPRLRPRPRRGHSRL